MRNITRLFTAVLFCGALLSAAFVGAQDTTATPTTEATVEVTTEPTVEQTMEATAEATMEATTEATAEAATAATSVGTLEATLTPTTAATMSTQSHSTNGIVCNPDLILNLYVAQHYFGLNGVISAAMTASTDPSAMIDVSKLDKGEYTALFTAPILVVPDSTMTQEQMQSAASMMTMDENTIMQQMASMMPPGTDLKSMTPLNPPAIPGEDATCTKLRTHLNRFFTILAFQGMQSDMSMKATAEATSSASANLSFNTKLSGANEVPAADPDGTGNAIVTLDMANSQICYTLSVQNIALPAAAAHIHRGAAGVKGGVVVPFDVVPDVSGSATSCVNVDPALLTEIATNPAGFYVNVHSSEFPDGAIRGQLSG